MLSRHFRMHKFEALRLALRKRFIASILRAPFCDEHRNAPDVDCAPIACRFARRETIR
jgi:hypothetical protein